MNKLLKTLGLFLVTMLFAAGALAASGPVLLVELPEEAQLVENVEFDDGDFIKTYQLEGGASVQLLRYAHFDMTLAELMESEWAEASDVQSIEALDLGGYASVGVRFHFEPEGGEPVQVTLVLVDAGEETLVYQAVYPEKLGETQIEESVARMLESMEIYMGGDECSLSEVG